LRSEQLQPMPRFTKRDGYCIVLIVHGLRSRRSPATAAQPEWGKTLTNAGSWSKSLEPHRGLRTMARHKRTLRNKIITWSFVPTAIILVAVALVSLYTYQRVTENLVVERDRELTRLSAEVLATQLAAYTNPLADQYLAIFDGVVLFEADGNVLATEPIQYDLKRPAWLADLSFEAMFQSSQPVYSNVIVDRLQGDRIIIVAIPVTPTHGQPSGGIVAFFRLGASADSALYKSIEKLRRGENDTVYLVDGRGRVIYHTVASRIGDDFSSLDAVQRVMAGGIGALRTRDFEGQEIVASYAPVAGTSWGLVAEENWAALTQSSRRYGQYLLLLLGVGIVAPIVIVTVGVRRITEPIAQLVRAAHEIAGGNFHQRITASSGDEMEGLAEQFNRMADRLQESYAHLEQKVAGRTRELATLNSIATQVSRSLDLTEILNNALNEVLEIMGMDYGLAFCLDEEREALTLMAHRGIADEWLSRAAQLPVEDCAVRQAVQTGQPIVRTGAEHAMFGSEQQAEHETTHLTICIPLMARGRALGAIRLDGQAIRSPASEELSLLAAIGHQIGVAVENARLYEQAQQLAVVSERNRLARDLHDSVMQALYGVTLYAEAAARQLASGDDDLAAGHLREIRNTTQEALREMRLLIFELRPPILKSDGLSAALQARLEAVEGHVGIQTEFVGTGDCRLSPEVEEGLYRIAQEALNNALKHAMASSVSVHLRGNQRIVVLEIADDGTGFDPDRVRERGGFGLRSMEERVARLGGKLTVQSKPGAGTTVRVEVCRS
jgi:signal transduction histidine kinase